LIFPDPESLIRRSPASAPLLDAVKDRKTRDAVRSALERFTGSGAKPGARAGGGWGCEGELRTRPSAIPPMKHVTFADGCMPEIHRCEQNTLRWTSENPSECSPDERSEIRDLLFSFDLPHIAALMRATGLQWRRFVAFRPRAQRLICRTGSMRFGSSSPLPKNIPPSRATQITSISLAVPARERGVSRSSRTLGMGCDGRGRAVAQIFCADERR
jgi:hypothetical protein